MNVQTFLRILGADFYAGVPDSLLKPLCDCLIATYGTDARHHIIAANEGNAVALAAGYHLATGKVPVVYLQNSGVGNIVNPVASLCNPAVYGIPVLFLVGWRGEPGIPDEPQHAFQGPITRKLLEDTGIPCAVLGVDTTEAELVRQMTAFQTLFSGGGQAAFLVRKGALQYDGHMLYQNGNLMCREEITRHVLAFSGNDCVIATTGKAGRELFELREKNGSGHERDFLTVGSMGHASSIALGMAAQTPGKRFWILDGDGAFLMHMGALATIGSIAPENIIHVVMNNAAHESVGGCPTVADDMDIPALARACGYPWAVSVGTPEELDAALKEALQRRTLCFIEAKCAIGARKNLGRPAIPPRENKWRFMDAVSRANNTRDAAISQN